MRNRYAQKAQHILQNVGQENVRETIAEDDPHMNKQTPTAHLGPQMHQHNSHLESHNRARNDSCNQHNGHRQNQYHVS